jgi:hypothetical protein
MSKDSVDYSILVLDVIRAAPTPVSRKRLYSIMSSLLRTEVDAALSDLEFRNVIDCNALGEYFAYKKHG